MSFGINLFNANGSLGYSSSDVTWNQVDFFSLGGGQGTVTASYQQLIGREVLVLQIFISPPPVDRKAIAYTITVSGAVVTMSGGSESVFIVVLMR